MVLSQHQVIIEQLDGLHTVSAFAELEKAWICPLVKSTPVAKPVHPDLLVAGCVLLAYIECSISRGGEQVGILSCAGCLATGMCSYALLLSNGKHALQPECWTTFTRLIRNNIFLLGEIFQNQLLFERVGMIKDFGAQEEQLPNPLFSLGFLWLQFASVP